MAEQMTLKEKKKIIRDRVFPESRVPKIYAWKFTDKAIAENASLSAHAGLIKVGYTDREDVRTRVEEVTGSTTGGLKFDYELLIGGEKGYEIAMGENGPFSDHDVHNILEEWGVERVRPNESLNSREWFRTDPETIIEAIEMMRRRDKKSRKNKPNFDLRKEQKDAVKKTADFFQHELEASIHNQPRFLWNAKMRFGKTIASYHLAQDMIDRGIYPKDARILVMTFKPATSSAWKEDLNHQKFSEWQYITSDRPPTNETIFKTQSPLVCFSSFQFINTSSSSSKTGRALKNFIRNEQWDLVIIDEYHFGAWRKQNKEMLGLVSGVQNDIFNYEDYSDTEEVKKEADEALKQTTEALSDINGKSFLCLSGTPFKALKSVEFVEDQIFNWTYTDEQEAKQSWSSSNPEDINPYDKLPEMVFIAYEMHGSSLDQHSLENDESWLNKLFAAEAPHAGAAHSKYRFVNEDEVRSWLYALSGDLHDPSRVHEKSYHHKFMPFSRKSQLRSKLNHTLWYFQNTASCHAMANLLRSDEFKSRYGEYEIIDLSAKGVGTGTDALKPVVKAVKDGHGTKTIILTAGKLTTGVTIDALGGVLMLRDLKASENYWQTAFRAQSPWYSANLDRTQENIWKPTAYLLDFNASRGYRQIAEYARKLDPNPHKTDEQKIHELTQYMPTLYVDAESPENEFIRVSAGQIMDISVAGTSPGMLAKKWQHKQMLRLFENGVLNKFIPAEGSNPTPSQKRLLSIIDKMVTLRKTNIADVTNYESFSEFAGANKAHQELKDRLKSSRLQEEDHDKQEVAKIRKQIRHQDNLNKAAREEIEDKLLKFMARLPIFMYLTDNREQSVRELVDNKHGNIFLAATGIKPNEFHMLIDAGVFDYDELEEAVKAFRRFEDSSLEYLGVRKNMSNALNPDGDTAINYTRIRQSQSYWDELSRQEGYGDDESTTAVSTEEIEQVIDEERRILQESEANESETQDTYEDMEMIEDISTVEGTSAVEDAPAVEDDKENEIAVQAETETSMPDNSDTTETRPAAQEPDLNSRSSIYITMKELFEAGYIKEGDLLKPIDGIYHSEVKIGQKGNIVFSGQSFSGPVEAALNYGGRAKAILGWSYWQLDSGAYKNSTLDTIKETYSKERNENKIHKKNKSENIPLKQLIEEGKITPGTSIEGSVKGVISTAIIRKDGKIEITYSSAYKSTIGSAHKTPSGAAVAVTKRSAVNGWAFWTISNGPNAGMTLSEIRDQEI